MPAAPDLPRSIAGIGVPPSSIWKCSAPG